MKTYPVKFGRTNWENDSFINRGDYNIEWNVVTDTHISIEIPQNAIETIADGETIVLFVSSFYYQFGNPPTRYKLTVKEEKSIRTPTGDTNLHGSITISRNGYKLIAKSIDCLI